MKKSSKILGSVALSAALVMGTAAPAFADTYPGSTTDASMPDQLNSVTERVTDGAATIVDTRTEAAGTDAAGSSTVVTVSTYTSQISVTVPLYLPIWLDTAGVADAIHPSDGKYYIQNNSPVAIKVDRAVYKNVGGTGLTFAATPGQNQFNITLTPQGKEVFVMNDTAANDTSASAPGATKIFTDWKIPTATGATDDSNKIVLPVSATNGKIDHAISDQKLATITYTVMADAGVNAPAQGTGTGNTGNSGPDASAQLPVANDIVTVAELQTKLGMNVVLKQDSASGATVTSEAPSGKAWQVVSVSSRANSDDDWNPVSGTAITSGLQYRVIVKQVDATTTTGE